MSLAQDGISCVKDYETRNGRNPVDVSKGRKFPGIDIISIDISKDDHRTIEVKATKGEGIPDAFETEFTPGLKFVATHLYVVRFEEDGKFDSLHIVPKDVIDEYSTSDRYGTAHRIVRHIKFASGLQTKIKNGCFRVALE